jgi:hypothetical protein
MRYRATRAGDVIIGGRERALFEGQTYELPAEAAASVPWLVPVDADPELDLDALGFNELRALARERGVSAAGSRVAISGRIRGTNV